MKKSQGRSQTLPAGELKRCRERLEDLKNCFKVSGLINSTLMLEEVLGRIMTTSRDMLKADACSLMLVDEKTQELVFEVAQGPVSNRLKGGFRLKKGEGIAGHVFETGKAVLVEDAYEDARFHREFDRKTGYLTRSVLCVPLMAKDRIIGVAQVINKIDGSSFTREDEEAFVLLCTHAAIAIENARMHEALLRKQQIESDLTIARSIQLSFLPQDVPNIPGFQFRTHYQAAMEVGGDFYDFIPLSEEHLGIVIGDVSGKGVASALYMARLTSDFRLYAYRHKNPARAVEQMNDLLCERSRRGMFVTLLYMVLDVGRRQITCANAGHLPPILWHRGENRYNVHPGGGPPLGILPTQRYVAEPITIRSGDCLILATDGLIEAKNPEGEMFGWERLEETLREVHSRAEDVHQQILKALKDFVQDRPQTDDTTIVLIGVEEL